MPKTVVRRIGGVLLRGRVVIRRLACTRTSVNPAVALVAARAALREASAAAAAHAVAADARAVVVRRSACAAALTRSLPCAFLQVSTSSTVACVATASSNRFDRASPTAALSAWIATAKFGWRCTFSAQKTRLAPPSTVGAEQCSAHSDCDPRRWLCDEWCRPAELWRDARGCNPRAHYKSSGEDDEALDGVEDRVPPISRRR